MRGLALAAILVLLNALMAGIAVITQGVSARRNAVIAIAAVMGLCLGGEVADGGKENGGYSLSRD